MITDITHKKYIGIKDIECWRISFELSNQVWKTVINWDHFAKDTIGKQFVRSTDSISANITEGFGRYGKKDKVRFYRIAYGSLKESQDWLLKAKTRNLLRDTEFQYLDQEFNKLPKSINSLIKYTNDKLAH